MKRVFYDAGRQRRVTIFRRDDSSFSFLEEYFSNEPLERCWLPSTAQRSIPFCDSFETAIREAAGRIEWFDAVVDLPGA